MSARKTRSAATGQSRQLRSNDPAADYLEDGTEGIDDLTRSAFPTVETVVEEDEEEEVAFSPTAVVPHTAPSGARRLEQARLSN